MYFSDLHRVIGEEVVPLELQVAAIRVESEHFPVVVKELFLRGNVTATKLLLQELQELWVLLGWNWLLGNDEGIFWAELCSWLWLFDILYRAKNKLESC